MFPTALSRTLMALVVLLLMAAPGRAQTAPGSASPDLRVVDFGSDLGFGYPRGTWAKDTAPNIDVDGDGHTDDDSVAGWFYHDDIPLSPPPALYDTHAPSAVFYGGIVLWTANNPKNRPSEGHINQDHESRDDFNFMTLARDQDALPGETQLLKGYALWYWKKADFLNGGRDHRVSFDDHSRIAVHISRYWGGVDWGRWVVRQRGQFYVSQATFGGLNEQFDRLRPDGQDAAKNPIVRKTHALVPTATRWAKYDPQDGYAIEFDADHATYEPVTFDDVEAVGFLLGRHLSPKRPVSKALSINEGIGVKWYAFEVDANVDRPRTPGFLVPLHDADGAHVSNDITFAQWQTIYRWAVSNQFCHDIPQTGYTFAHDGTPATDDANAPAAKAPGSAGGSFTALAPVTNISWLDGVMFCNAASELEGLTPVYYEDAACTKILRWAKERVYKEKWGTLPTVHLKADANGYRLPGPVPDAADMTALLPRLQIAAGPTAAKAPGPAGSVSAPTPTVTKSSALAALHLILVPNAGMSTAADQPTTENSKPADDRYPLYVQSTEASYAFWHGVQSWAQAHGYTFDFAGDPGSIRWSAASSPADTFGPDEPVTFLGWHDALIWCNALSELTGRKPVYYTDEAHTQVYRAALPFRIAMYQEPSYPNNPRHPRMGDPLHTGAFIDLFTDPTADGFRLPTPAEFDAYNPTVPTAQADAVSWHDTNAGDRTHPVGTKQPNALGLFDTEGNVSEWCYGGSQLFGRTHRGGDFSSPFRGRYNAHERKQQPSAARAFVGFRVVTRTAP